MTPGTASLVALCCKYYKFFMFIYSVVSAKDASQKRYTPGALQKKKGSRYGRKQKRLSINIMNILKNV